MMRYWVSLLWKSSGCNFIQALDIILLSFGAYFHGNHQRVPGARVAHGAKYFGPAKTGVPELFQEGPALLGAGYSSEPVGLAGLDVGR